MLEITIENTKHRTSCTLKAPTIPYRLTEKEKEIMDNALFPHQECECKEDVISITEGFCLMLDEYENVFICPALGN